MVLGKGSPHDITMGVRICGFFEGCNNLPLAFCNAYRRCLVGVYVVFWVWSFIWELLDNIISFSHESYLLLPSSHVSRLLCIKWVCNAAHHKYIELESLFPFLLFPLHLFQILFLFVARHRGAGAGGTAAAATTRRLKPTATIGGSVR